MLVALWCEVLCCMCVAESCVEVVYIHWVRIEAV